MKHRTIFCVFIALFIFFSCINKRLDSIFPSTKDFTITTNPDTLIDLPYYSLTYQVKVLSLPDWIIEENPNWVAFDTLSFKGIEKEVVLEIHVLENMSKEQREGVITLTNSAGEKAFIIIYQQGNVQENQDNIELSLNTDKLPDTIDFTGGTYEVLVKCSKNWSVENPLSWVYLQETAYEGSSLERKIQLKVLLNKSTEREGEIIFKSEDKEIPIKIRQLGYHVGYSQHDIDFDNSLVPAISSSLPNRNVIMKTNPSGLFYLSTDDDWVQIHGDATVSTYKSAELSFKDNLLPYRRTTNLYLKRRENINGSFVFITCAVHQIEQEAAIPFLEINKMDRSFEAPSKETRYALEVFANEDFQIQGNPSWIRMEKGVTNSNSKTPITIIVDKNLSSQRTANFSISLKSGAVKLDFTLTQKAAFVQTYPFNMEYGIILKARIKDGIDKNFSTVNYVSGRWANSVVFTLPSDREATSETKKQYGFVTDAPSVNKTLATPPIFSNYNLTDMGKPYAQIYIPNYNGQSSTFNMEVGIFYNLLHTYYRRLEISNVPVPAGLTSENVLIYTIDIYELESGNINPQYKISYTID